ncbi:MAG: prepilin-type N-terminal cleavage/methylation domain-containing protein [Akkermansia sp.]|nr:prepilin-type N-terminal cleavage/methylation domain-containing protein [Akkermansia sp.]
MSHRSKGFTLIELIVVIAILATLASIAYPAYMSFMDDAKRTSSAKTCADIVEAVTRFRTDNNGMLPYVVDAVKPDKNDQIFLKTADGEDADMLKILTNNEDDEDNRVNSLKEFYLKSTEVEEPVDGLYTNPNNGELGLYDPWGNPYYVVLCEEEGCLDPFASRKKRLRNKPCIVYGLGPDGIGVAPTGKVGKKDKAASKEDAEIAAEEAADAILDNVYSWKKVSK